MSLMKSSNSKYEELDMDKTQIPKVDGDQNVSKEKLERMRFRMNKKKNLLYPEDTFKVNWDLFITLILLISCITTPFRIAFGDLKEPI